MKLFKYSNSELTNVDNFGLAVTEVNAA